MTQASKPPSASTLSRHYPTTGSMQNLLSAYIESDSLANIDTEATKAIVKPSISERLKAFERPPQAPLIEICPMPASVSLVTETPTAWLEPMAREQSPIESKPSDQDQPQKLDVSTEWPAKALELIETLQDEIANLQKSLAQQVEMTKSAEALADNDVLTPTLNRRAFLRELSRTLADCRRYNEQACLIFIDLDGFKAINDVYGHAAGDCALIHVAELLKTNIREGDTVGRLGGDEFCVLLRRAEPEGSKLKAMILEAELSMATFYYNGLYLKICGAFGLRPFQGQQTAEQWLAEADAAMFLNKRSSRR